MQQGAWTQEFVSRSHGIPPPPPLLAGNSNFRYGIFVHSNSNPIYAWFMMEYCYWHCFWPDLRMIWGIQLCSHCHWVTGSLTVQGLLTQCPLHQWNPRLALSLCAPPWLLWGSLEDLMDLLHHLDSTVGAPIQQSRLNYSYSYFRHYSHLSVFSSPYFCL